MDYNQIQVENKKFKQVESQIINAQSGIKRMDYNQCAGQTAYISVNGVKAALLSLLGAIDTLMEKTVEYFNWMGVTFEQADHAVRDSAGNEIVTGSGATRQQEQAKFDELDLSPNMGNYSMNQYEYPMYYDGYNAGCCATAYAIGLSMVTGNAYNPTQFWRDGATHYDAGYVGDYNSYNANDILNALKNGKPTMVHFEYGSSGQHWVLAKGISEGANLSNLGVEDIIVIDPLDGQERTLAEAMRTEPGGVADVSKIKGMKVFN